MADIVLGSTPESLAVILTKDADFFTTLTTEDGSNWPVTAQIKLILGTYEAVATISGPDASISIDEVDVNTIITSRTTNAKLMYIDGTAKICWALGVVAADG